MAILADRLAQAHGFLPYYPGKWRISRALCKVAEPEWKKGKTFTRRGFRIRLDPRNLVSAVLYSDGWFDPNETFLLGSMLPPGGVCFDVGANIGFFALNMSRAVGAGGRVFAFEPVRHTFAALCDNLTLNNARNVSAHCIALGDRDAAIRLNVVGDNRMGSSFVTREPGDTKMTTLDKFVHEHLIERVDYIKCDIEGFECKFLSGATHTIQTFRPPMIMELNPAALKRAGDDESQLFSMLTGLGYEVSEILAREGRLRRLETYPAKRSFLNILASPRS